MDKMNSSSDTYQSAFSNNIKDYISGLKIEVDDIGRN
jgi:hypothetical protein